MTPCSSVSTGKKRCFFDPKEKNTSQLQVEEATWRKSHVRNHRTTMNYHLILKKYPEVDIVASQHYALDHGDYNCDGKVCCCFGLFDLASVGFPAPEPGEHEHLRAMALEKSD